MSTFKEISDKQESEQTVRYAANLLEVAHRDLIAAASPLPAGEGDLIVTLATIIDHTKRVLIGQDIGYRREKAAVVLAEAHRLADQLGGLS